VTSYDAVFHRYTAATSAIAARRITRIVRSILPLESVLDVGCGYGTWLRAWRELGVTEVQGVDGPWVDPTKLEIPPQSFAALDLSEPFSLSRRFDLVQSLEVAEHLPASRAATFVANLTAHADAVLFSAAPPGQGGENHVNEQPYDYWRRLFHDHEFVAIDCVRPLVAGDASVSAWYRYNTLLYLRPTALAAIPEYVRMFRVAEDAPVPDVAPSLYRWRRSAVRVLPQAVQYGLARGLARWHARRWQARRLHAPSAP